jgi:acetyl esterase/lipase
VNHPSQNPSRRSRLPSWLLAAALLLAGRVQAQAADSTPDAFSFPSITRAEPGSAQLSAPITVGGIDGPVAISISAGSYSINDGPFASTAGTVVSGDRVRARLIASTGFMTSSIAAVRIGTASASFKVTTRAVDIKPDPYSFVAIKNAPAGVEQTSNEVTISGIEAASRIVVTGGSYSLNGGPFQSAAGPVQPGDRLRLRIAASATAGAQVVVGSEIEGVGGAFRVTTSTSAAPPPPTPDSVPDALAFPARDGVEPGSVQTSSIIEVRGINVPTPIAVVGGEYALDGASFTGRAGSVTNGSRVQLRLIAAAQHGQQVQARLSVGGVDASFTVTTAALDLMPDPFAFPAQVGAAPGAARISDEIVVGGVNGPVEASVVGGRYSVNDGPFGAAPGIVRGGDRLRVEVLAAGQAGGVSVARLSIGGFAADFSVTTSTGGDSQPQAFAFPEVADGFPGLAVISEPRTLTGFDSPAPVLVRGGAYSLNGAAYTERPGMAQPGDVLRLLAIPAALNGEAVTTEVEVGGVAAAFRVVTAAPVDSRPDFFRFADFRLAPLATAVTSEAVTIRGINVPVEIVADAGTTYSLNDGPFTAASGTVLPGDRLRLRFQTPATRNIDCMVAVTIGGYRYRWALKTTPATTVSQPEPFTLTPATIFSGGRVLPGSAVLSRPVVISGASNPQLVSITGGGEYRINDGPFIASGGLVVNGDRVVVRLYASTSFGGTASANLRIGSLSSTMTIATIVDPVAATPLTLPPAAGTTVMTYVFRNTGPVPLRVHVFFPAGWRASDRRSAYIDWFGGGWSDGSTENSGDHARSWAKNQGMVGIAPDYRTNTRFGTYATVAVDDARAAVRWVQENAPMLGVDPTRIAVGGSSAGGGNALWTALAEPPAGTEAASSPLLRPAAVVMRCGVADTTAAFGQGDTRLQRFGDLQDEISALQRVDAAMPPVLAFHGDHDDLVAQGGVVNLCTALRRLGRDCEFHNQPGLDHFWFSAPGRKEAATEQTRQFFVRHGLLPAVR